MTGDTVKCLLNRVYAIISNKVVNRRIPPDMNKSLISVIGGEGGKIPIED